MAGIMLNLIKHKGTNSFIQGTLTKGIWKGTCCCMLEVIWGEHSFLLLLQLVKQLFEVAGMILPWSVLTVFCKNM